MTPVEFETDDKVQVRGEVFEHENPEGVSIIHGATGVPMGYYRSFAKWLCDERRHHVLIYSYRDSEIKDIAKLRASTCDMRDWGVHDQSAALDYVLNAFPDLPVHTIGHSLGGMCLPYHKNADKVQSHVAVNSGPAYWRNHPWHFIPKVILFWFVLGPVLARILGYLPGSLFGVKTNLPPEVYWQWRRWCSNPDFFEIDWNSRMEPPDFSRVSCSVSLVGTADDDMIPPYQVRKLAKYFPNASIAFKSINPTAIGLKSIGHIGIFAPRCEVAWPAIIDQGKQLG
ncbi:MAG: alpha/beta fold hydrolase [Pseudomonadota bacterium]